MNKYKHCSLNELYAIQDTLLNQLTVNTEQLRKEIQAVTDEINLRYEELDEYYRNYNE